MGRMLCRYLVEAASRETGVSVDALMGRSKTAKIAHARRLIYYATPEAGISLSEMGRYLNRDHSTLAKMIGLKNLTLDQRRTVEAIKLTAQSVAREHAKKLTAAFAQGVAA